MCWEERHIILSQTTLTILFRTKCFPVFPLQFLQIMMNFARFKNQRTYWMLTATRLWDEKGWCFGEIYQYLPYKPAWGWKWMQQEANSCFQQQFGAVFILLCPFEPQMHTECALSQIHPSSTCTLSWIWLWSWGRISIQCWSFFWDKYPKPECSLEISLHRDSFPSLGHHVLYMFLQKASSGTACDLVCTALKGTWEGQCTRYMALLKGQIHIAPSTLVLNSKGHLPKINCCSISCLKPNCSPLGAAPSQSKSRDHC